MSGLKVKTKVKIIGDENVKIIFRAYLRQNWIDLRQIKTRTITAHYTYIVKYILPAETFRFCDICLSVCHIPFVHSTLERGKKFIFFGQVTRYASE